MVNNYSQKLDELEYFLQKCMVIDKKLGGNRFGSSSTNKATLNPLNDIELRCTESLFQLKKKIEDRD